MRFRRTKHDRVLVVGIFQSPKTGRAVLKSLHRTQFRRAAASLARCASTILPGETVVLAEVRATEAPRLLAILRDVEAEAAVTFAFHSAPHFRFKSSARPLGSELPSGQRLAENAARLAHEI